MGLQVSKLETVDSSKQGFCSDKNCLSSYFPFPVKMLGFSLCFIYLSLGQLWCFNDENVPFMNWIFTTFIDIHPGKERYSIRSWLTDASAKTSHKNRSSSHEKCADAGLTSLLAFFASVQIFVASDHAYCMIEVLLTHLNWYWNSMVVALAVL